MTNDFETDDIETDELERSLREGLQREANRITPNERRAEILAMAHDETRMVERKKGWLIPGAAAASVALIGATIWGVSSTGDNQPLTPLAKQASSSRVAAVAAPTKASKSPRPSVTLSSTAPVTAPILPPATTERNGAGATTQVALPAYFVGASSAAGDRFGLYREFVRTGVPAGATPAQKAKAAVAVAMNAQAFTGFEPYLQPWSSTSVTKLTVTPSRVTITLSGPGAAGFTRAQTKLAVQELVWTAQAALGKGPVPVKFVVAGGSPKLFGTYPTAQTYNRPPKDQQYEVLAPIWITSPVRSQVYPAGAAVVASGQSCAFEATTQWQLKKGATVVRSGSTTATSGCPTRGTWQVRLGVLPAGSYTFRMYEVSMQDGKGMIAETSKPFTVK